MINSNSLKVFGIIKRAKIAYSIITRLGIKTIANESKKDQLNRNRPKPKPKPKPTPKSN